MEAALAVEAMLAVEVEVLMLPADNDRNELWELWADKRELAEVCLESSKVVLCDDKLADDCLSCSAFWRSFDALDCRGDRADLWTLLGFVRWLEHNKKVTTEWDVDLLNGIAANNGSELKVTVLETVKT